jgi:hypothetical protein
MFQFDWQARGEDFVKWMFVHLIAEKHGVDHSPKIDFEELSDATNGFRNVQLTMQVNGIEVNAQNFIESVENAIKQYAEQAAQQIVAESIPDLEELQDTVYHAQKAIADRLKNSLKSAGITWNED